VADIRWKEVDELGWISEPNVPIFRDTMGRNFILCQYSERESGETIIEPIKEVFDFKSKK
jgi:hypothetical protein